MLLRYNGNQADPPPRSLACAFRFAPLLHKPSPATAASLLRSLGFKKNRSFIAVSQAIWTKQGETLSHKNACKEFGLEKSEIIEAIRKGKLQY